MAAVDSLRKNKSVFRFVWQQFPTQCAAGVGVFVEYSIPLQLFCSLENLPVIVWTVFCWNADYLM